MLKCNLNDRPNEERLWFNVIVFSVVRADNWRVDEGTEPSEHDGLSPFGKVWQQGCAA